MLFQTVIQVFTTLLASKQLAPNPSLNAKARLALGGILETAIVCLAHGAGRRVRLGRLLHRRRDAIKHPAV
jgi:hypothetical protein